MKDENKIYEIDNLYEKVGIVAGVIIGGIIFIGCWIYCIKEYGFLLGVGLGWLASGITAVVIGVLIRYLWGPAVIGAIILFLYLLSNKN